MSEIGTKLQHFILHEMQMSHIYQPVMLAEILRSNGTASVTQIAKALLAYDTSQIEYYEKITKNMVGRVLTNNRQITIKEGANYRIKDFEELTPDEVLTLVKACEAKITSYVAKRGIAIWNHRKLAKGYVPGTVRYEVLKRAKYRCELCGISAEDKALEVDHIFPRSQGGGDELHNFQALCYSCNATKRHRDDTDFRGIAARYDHREAGCLFCELPTGRIVDENELAVAFKDAFPVTDSHTLIIPKRHVADYFDLYAPERNAIEALLQKQKLDIQADDTTVSAFNIGINAGAEAGQTIFHCHIHLIPRRLGDVEDPRGGIRGIIPNKQKY